MTTFWWRSSIIKHDFPSILHLSFCIGRMGGRNWEHPTIKLHLFIERQVEKYPREESSYYYISKRGSYRSQCDAYNSWAEDGGEGRSNQASAFDSTEAVNMRTEYTQILKTKLVPQDKLRFCYWIRVILRCDNFCQLIYLLSACSFRHLMDGQEIVCVLPVKQAGCWAMKKNANMYHHRRHHI